MAVVRPETKYERRLVATVAKHGWQATAVPDGEPSFCYSVGFIHTLGVPELIVFGLPPDSMHHMLTLMFQQLRSGETLTEDKRWAHLLDGFDCVTRPAPVSRDGRPPGLGALVS